MSELGDLLELLHGTRRQWRTVRVVIHDWSHNERSRAVFDRRIERMERKGTSINRVSFYGPGSREPRPETREQTMRFWLDGERSREEREDEHGTSVVVHQGGTWWMTSPHTGPMTNDGNPTHHAGSSEDVEQLLDPAELPAAFELELRGREDVAGRPGIAVRATPREREHRFHFFWQLLDVDELEVVIDAEYGIILRSEALVDGEPYFVRELVEVAFDETFPPETFRIELPLGETFELAGGPRPAHLTLDEVARRASFRLFIPARPGPGWHLEHATYFAASERPLRMESVHLSYSHETGAHQFQLAESTESHPWLGSEELATVERDGIVLKVLDPSEEDAPMPRHVLVERDGTHVNLMSQDLPLNELIELAASLVPAPDSPPPAIER